MRRVLALLAAAAAASVACALDLGALHVHEDRAHAVHGATLLLRNAAVRVHARDAPPDGRVVVRHDELHDAVGAAEEGEACGLVQWMVHLHPPLTRARVEAVNAAIAPHALATYLPHNTMVAVGPAQGSDGHDAFWEALIGSPHVAWAAEMGPSLKTEPSHVLGDATEGEEDSEDAEGLDEIVVHLESDFERLCPGSGDARRLAREWAAAVPGLEPVAQSGGGSPVVQLRLADPDGLAAAAAYLAARPHAHWVEARRRLPKVQNKYASRLVQDGRENSTRMYDHGLRGEGEVVQWGDTGIDHDHCFFRDESRPVPVTSLDKDGRIVSLDMEHRKIVCYVVVRLAGDGDELNGHGTHTAGTLAGAAMSTASPSGEAANAPYNGVAPAARLAAFDFKSSKSNALRVPSDPYTDMLAPAYEQAGARVGSNSWGADDGIYGAYSVGIDGFVWDRPEFLPVFAAGNYGARGFSTITSPGVAKNTLTVGSHYNAAGSFTEIGSGATVTLRAAAGASDAARTYHVVPALFGARVSEFRLPEGGARVVAAEPRNACAALDATAGGANYTGAVVLVTRGVCKFDAKATRVQEAGGVAMMLYDTKNDGSLTIIMSPDSLSAGVRVLAFAVGRSDGARVTAALERGDRLLATGPGSSFTDREPERHISSFSSRGPVRDGRLKPDMLAPGDSLQSARADGKAASNQCPSDRTGVIDMQGTSMAAPVAAGAALLLRQYLREGFHPSGRRNAADAYEPRGPLLKAMLVHGAVPAAPAASERLGNFRSGVPPTVYQGHGRLWLGHVTRFRGGGGDEDDDDDEWDRDSRGWAVWFDEGEAVQGLNHVQCFRVRAPDTAEPGAARPTTELAATLAWVEPAGSGASLSAAVANDLNLAVVEVRGGAAGEPVLGNGYRAPTGGTDPEYAPVHDSLNNLEKAVVSVPPGGGEALFAVHVAARRVVTDRAAPYALVVSGPSLEAVNASLCEAGGAGSVCPGGCGPGTCASSIASCQCPAGTGGARCAMTATPVAVREETLRTHGQNRTRTAQWQVSDSVAPLETRFYRIELNGSLAADSASPSSSSGRTLTVSVAASSGEAHVFVRRGQFPTFAAFEAASASKSGAAPARLAVPTDEATVYVIGVYGSEASTVTTFRMSVSVAETGPVPVPPIPWVHMIAGVAAVMLALFVISYCCRRACMGGRRCGFEKVSHGVAGDDDDWAADSEYDEVEVRLDGGGGGGGGGGGRIPTSAAEASRAAAPGSFRLVDSDDEYDDDDDEDDDDLVYEKPLAGAAVAAPAADAAPTVSDEWAVVESGGGGGGGDDDGGDEDYAQL